MSFTHQPDYGFNGRDGCVIKEPPWPHRGGRMSEISDDRLAEMIGNLQRVGSWEVTPDLHIPMQVRPILAVAEELQRRRSQQGALERLRDAVRTMFERESEATQIAAENRAAEHRGDGAGAIRVVYDRWRGSLGAASDAKSELRAILAELDGAQAG